MISKAYSAVPFRFAQTTRGTVGPASMETYDGSTAPTPHAGRLRLTSTTSQVGISILGVTGNVDLQSADRLREHALGLLADRPPRMVIQLDEVTFLDSRGLAALAAIQCRASSLGVELRLTTPAADGPTKVLGVRYLDKGFDLYSSLTEALQVGPPYAADAPYSGRAPRELS